MSIEPRYASVSMVALLTDVSLAVGALRDLRRRQSRCKGVKTFSKGFEGTQSRKLVSFRDQPACQCTFWIDHVLFPPCGGPRRTTLR